MQQKLLPAIARLRKAGGSILAHAHAMAVSPCNKAPRLCRSGIRKHKVRGIQPIAVLIKPASLYHRPANGDAQAIARLGIIDRIGQPTGGIVSTGGDAQLIFDIVFHAGQADRIRFILPSRTKGILIWAGYVDQVGLSGPSHILCRIGLRRAGRTIHRTCRRSVVGHDIRFYSTDRIFYRLADTASRR